MRVSPLAGSLRGAAAAVIPAALAREAVRLVPGSAGGPWLAASACLGSALTGALVEDPDLFAGQRLLSILTGSVRRDALEIREYLARGQAHQAGRLLGASAGQVSGALTGAALGTNWALELAPGLTELARGLPLPPEVGPWLPALVSVSSVALGQMVGGTVGGWVGQAVGGAVGGAFPYATAGP